MPGQMTERERQDFLAEPHVAVLSVTSEGDRPPHTTPVWYAYDPGGDLTFFTGTQGRRPRKAGLIQKAGVLSVTVQREVFPYRYVTAECTVVGVDRRPPRGSPGRSSNIPHPSSSCTRSGRTAG
jgi:uncharacterized protein